jgi:DNA repair photolyase
MAGASSSPNKGRGAQSNPQNRFEKTGYGIVHPEAIDDWELKPRKTQYIFDESKSIVNRVDSPDVGMLWSANPYQGCEHGCVYCYARNSHEYWGYSPGLDFESRIVVKKDAPELLRKFLSRKSWQPAVISLSGNTDCYQPIERQMRITRQLLQVCLEFRNPVGIVTKNQLVLRDLDLLQEMASHHLVRVCTSITSLDEDLRRVLEPRTSAYRQRLKVLEALTQAGIPTGVMAAPIIPGLNDSHLPAILEAAAQHGASWAGYTMVRLNGAVGMLFREWLQTTFPERADKVWNAIMDVHNGQVSSSTIGERMRGTGARADIIEQQFNLYARKYGLNTRLMEYNTADFRVPAPDQGSLF